MSSNPAKPMAVLLVPLGILVLDLSEICDALEIPHYTLHHRVEALEHSELLLQLGLYWDFLGDLLNPVGNAPHRLISVGVGPVVSGLV